MLGAWGGWSWLQGEVRSVSQAGDANRAAVVAPPGLLPAGSGADPLPPACPVPDTRLQLPLLTLKGARRNPRALGMVSWECLGSRHSSTIGWAPVLSGELPAGRKRPLWPFLPSLPFFLEVGQQVHCYNHNELMRNKPALSASRASFAVLSGSHFNFHKAAASQMNP